MTDTMREIFDDLDGLYTNYLNAMNQLEVNRASLQGFFGRIFGGAGIGSDSSNDVFYDGFRRCVERFADINPTSQETLIFMRFVLNQNVERQTGIAAGLMLEAVHGCLIPLTGFLSKGHREEFLEEYLHAYPAKRQSPVQGKLVRALQKKA